MSLPRRAFEDLSAGIVAAGGRVGAALAEPSQSESAAQLLNAANDMDVLRARVRAAADAADMQSRRPVTRG